MNSVICTLFEGHYHHGVAALINSLFDNGYRGTVYVGYRGSLPEWASSAKTDTSALWPGSCAIQAAERLNIYFLPLQTGTHLTNYKPYFMLDLWQGLAKEAEAMVYFDPDIVVKSDWIFFEKWMGYGIALVQEIANYPMSSSHPTRLGWGEIIEKSKYNLENRLAYYFNAGFCGVSRKNIGFIKIWCDIIDIAEKYFDFNRNLLLQDDRNHHFNTGDQDALNIAAMCSKLPISEIGPYGMDFTPGDSVMSHATGSPKPWKKNFLLSAIKGFKPSRADKSYWNYTKGPLITHNQSEIKIAHYSILLASMLGRFYSRS